MWFIGGILLGILATIALTLVALSRVADGIRW